MTKINFGYTINADRQLDYAQADLRLARYLEKHERSFSKCISCGTCAATCSAGLFTDFSLRELIIRVKRGNLKGIREESEKCMLCGKCQLICPRLVNTRNIILEIQRGCEIFKL
jgi:heterodisulfide reductase subunit C